MIKKRAAFSLFLTLCAAPFALAQDSNPATTPEEAQSEPSSDATLIGPIQQWDVCNETSYVQRTATAFVRGGRMVAKGWDEILPGACMAHIVPVDSPRFLYAESLPFHLGGVREWKGETTLCIEDNDFESDATEDCALANRGTREYLAVRPGEPVTSLIEPADYGRERAVIAAQQRLLQDAGFKVTQVDGLPGRRTGQQLREFRKSKELPLNLEGEPLLRALIEAAKTRREEVGLEICNESSAPVWAAIALRRDGTWNSRGWWRAEPGACTKPINKALPGTEAHVFALQESADGPDLRLRTVSTVPAQFCIAQSRFSALGNEFCPEQGYAIASFRPVPTDADGARMRLSDQDFAAVNPSGLRR